MRLGALLLCGLVLASGFIYAAEQHFAALRLGYRSEELRTARQHLLEEQHRLMLEREEVAAPARLEHAARQMGMQAVQAGQIDSQKDGAKDSLENARPDAPPATTDSPASTANGAGTD
jgi:cell division protein FtsL